MITFIQKVILASPRPSPKSKSSQAQSQIKRERGILLSFTKSYLGSRCDSGWMLFAHTQKMLQVFIYKIHLDQQIRQSSNTNPTSTLASIPDKTTNDFLRTIPLLKKMHGLGETNRIKKSGVGQMGVPGHSIIGVLENLMIVEEMKILLKSTLT